MKRGRLKFKNLLSPDLDKPAERYAAVSMLINFQGDTPYLVVTKRSEFVRSHRGQISFAGGKGEKDDPSVLATALRETEEELGVPSDDFEILGRLPELTSVDGLIVVPFIITCENLQIDLTNIDLQEVAAVYQVPFAEVTKGNEKKFEFTAFGRHRNTYYYETSVVRIWGLTAQIIHHSEAQLY